MINYTAMGAIVRGSRWPPANDNLTVRVTKSSGWPAGSNSWIWELLLSRSLSGGISDLTLTGSNKSITDNILSMDFYATPAQTAALEGSPDMIFRVELKSNNSGEISYYASLQGSARVRDYAGEG